MKKQLVLLLNLVIIMSACVKGPSNWAEKLGYPKGAKVIMLHADDAGMSIEANQAISELLSAGDIQSTAVMAPCPAAEEFLQWTGANTEIDIGMHLTLTSEWKTYRWGPLTDSSEVPGLTDPDGMFWHEVPQVVEHATPAEVEKEIRAQIEYSLTRGHRPSHIDTHMGTLYGHPEYLKVFFKVAEEYGIPANAIDLSNKKVAKGFRNKGYPINDEVIAVVAEYTLPKLDFFTSAPKGPTYEEKKEKFKKLVKSLPSGLTEIIFHPSTETEQLKGITNSWQQRVWEYQMFRDPDMKEFFKEEEIIFTNWTEIMKKFKEIS